MSLLEVDGLTLTLAAREPRVIVDALRFSLDAGETLAIVGESGSGKTQAALALLGLQAPAMRVSGSVRFDGHELLGAGREKLDAIRGARIGFVFQDPLVALNPYLRIGTQIAETIEVHHGATREAARAEALRLLDAVQIAEAPRRLRQYPHELSGGMRQRVMLAVALACRPSLLIADEPTTALDVTIQQELIALLGSLRRDLGLALLLITHDLGLVSELCANTLVLYAGQTMEVGPTAALLHGATQPYTRALLRARPTLDLDATQPLAAIPGAPPSRATKLKGCAFAERCPLVLPICHEQPPPLEGHDMIARHCHRGVAEVRAAL